VFQAAYFESYVGGESRRKVRWAGLMVLIVVGVLILSMAFGLISDDTGPPPTTYPTLQFPTVPFEAPPDD
jgi:drug/metabolite transporter (DMT)-like permease